MGYAKYFLGLEITRSNSGMYLSQRKYALNVTKDVDFSQVKSTTIPLPKGLKLSAAEGEPLLELKRYRRLVGRLLFLNLTHPDITFAVHQLSEFMQCPRQPHWDAAIHVLKFLQGCQTIGLFFPTASNFILID